MLAAGCTGRISAGGPAGQGRRDRAQPAWPAAAGALLTLVTCGGPGPAPPFVKALVNELALRYVE
jgi:hypothetical protein